MAQPIPRGLKLFLGIFIIVGAIVIGCGAYTLIRSLRCEHWPTTDGVVQSAQMARHEGDADHGDTYSADVSYSYQVAGVNYDGNRLAFGSVSSSSSYAQGILNHYPVGQKVSVHYDPANPELAVLETGIHGGTWVCFGVGTVFLLAGIMFLQVFSRANKVDPATAPHQATLPARSTQQPPVLMGVIFMLMGSFAFFAPPSVGTPRWVVYAAGGMFVLFGVFMLTQRLENKLLSNIFKWAGLLAFLAIFHWVSFGPGERIGSSTTSFSHRTGVNVKTPFAIFTVLMDLAIVAGLVHWFVKRRKD
jgi:hypothetical protein